MELVARGTLALQLPIWHGHSGGTIWANTGVSVAGLRQTQKAAGLVGTCIMAWWAISNTRNHLLILTCNLYV